jgi:hypothetical protein
MCSILENGVLQSAKKGACRETRFPVFRAVSCQPRVFQGVNADAKLINVKRRAIHRQGRDRLDPVGFRFFHP